MAASAVLTYQMLGIARFTTGRRILALSQMRQVAQGRGLAWLIARIDEAIAHDRYALHIYTTWAAIPRNRLYNRGIIELRRLSSRTLTGIRDIALGQAKGRPADNHRAVLVKEFLRSAFPGGVGAITSQPYVDQAAAQEDLLADLRGPLASMVAELGLGAQVEHLAELTSEYCTALKANIQPVTYAEVRAANDHGQELLSAIVALILGTYYRHADPDHAEARAALLGPVLLQDAAIRAYLGSRRSVRDVNPDTGEEAEAPAGADNADATTEAEAGTESDSSAGSNGEDGAAGTDRLAVKARSQRATAGARISDAAAGTDDASAPVQRAQRRRRRRSASRLDTGQHTPLPPPSMRPSLPSAPSSPSSETSRESISATSRPPPASSPGSGTEGASPLLLLPGSSS